MTHLPGMVLDCADGDMSSNELLQVSKRSTEDGKRSLQASQASTTASMEWSVEDGRSIADTASDSDLELWSQRDETVIIFDWDDTLCPTSHFLKNPSCLELDAQAFEHHAKAVERLLEIAAGLGHVTIVSMAGPGWIEDTMQELMPSVRRTINALNIPIALATVGASRTNLREDSVRTRLPGQFLKRKTFAKVLRDFYSSRIGRRPDAKTDPKRGRSWKNVVSIGDSHAERLALQDVVMTRAQRDRNGRWKECRCKTIKLLTHPSLVELTAQARAVAKVLSAVVHHDGDIDYDVEESEVALRGIQTVKR